MQLNTRNIQGPVKFRTRHEPLKPGTVVKVKRHGRWFLGMIMKGYVSYSPWRDPVSKFIECVLDRRGDLIPKR